MYTALLLIAGLAMAAALVFYFFPRRTLPALLVVARAACGLKRQRVVVDGYTWHYLDSGGSNPAVLLIHGFGADKDTWLPYARLLRRKFRVIAPDLPGFGETLQDPDLDYSAATQSERLRRFIAVLELDTVHLAGNSLGGFISGCFAVRFPESVRSLAFIDAAGIEGSSKSDADLAIDRGDNPFTVADFAAFEKMLGMVAYKPPRIPLFIKKALYQEALSRKPFLDSIFWKLLNDLKSTNLREQLHRLLVPTLILWGREDRLVHVSSAMAIHERVPNSSLVILDQIGHVPMIEAPIRTAGLHMDFIDGLEHRKSAVA
jgi:pimeloyl-ACP methyl ester carboxylesterase